MHLHIAFYLLISAVMFLKEKDSLLSFSKEPLLRRMLLLWTLWECTKREAHSLKNRNIDEICLKDVIQEHKGKKQGTSGSICLSCTSWLLRDDGSCNDWNGTVCWMVRLKVKEVLTLLRLHPCELKPAFAGWISDLVLKNMWMMLRRSIHDRFELWLHKWALNATFGPQRGKTPEWSLGFMGIMLFYKIKCLVWSLWGINWLIIFARLQFCQNLFDTLISNTHLSQ